MLEKNTVLGLRARLLNLPANLQGKWQEAWLPAALGFSRFVPGLIIGFLVGLLVELPKGGKSLPTQPSVKKRITGSGRRGLKSSSGTTRSNAITTEVESGELKMVFVVRQDLKMGAGKIASQCAHAAVGTYEECLSRGQRLLLKKWEDCGQPKIVVTCKTQHEMNELRARAERAGLPVFTVADAGRTQVAAGSKTVLAIGPGAKVSIDNITGHLKLL